MCVYIGSSSADIISILVNSIMTIMLITINNMIMASGSPAWTGRPWAAGNAPSNTNNNNNNTNDSSVMNNTNTTSKTDNGSNDNTSSNKHTNKSNTKNSAGDLGGVGHALRGVGAHAHDLYM